MKPECVEAAKYGKKIKIQLFDTPKGKYLLSYRRLNGDVYMFKYRDGKLLECVNLNKVKGLDEK